MIILGRDHAKTRAESYGAMTDSNRGCICYSKCVFRPSTEIYRWRIYP